MTDFVADTLKDIKARRRELEPLVEEYRQLEEAQRALEGVSSGGNGPKPRAAAKSTGRRRRSSSGSGGRRGRPRGSGKRAQEALALVAGKPGVTIPELAKQMKIQPNYLYRVLPGLEQEGKVKRKNKGWHPA